MLSLRAGLLTVAFAALGLMGPAGATPRASAPVPDAADSADAAPPPALGLIVRLKDTPATAPAKHVGGPTAAGLARESEPTLAQRAAAHRQRLQTVLGELRLSPRALRTGGSGRSQYVDFGRVLRGDEAAEIARRLRARPEIEWVEPNVRERLLQVVEPNDPLFAQQWWLLSAADATAAHARRRGVPGVQTAWARLSRNEEAPVIAVLDTGITAHPELEGRLLPGYDFVDDSTHGAAADGQPGRDDDPSDPGDALSAEEAQLDAFQGCTVVERSSWHGTTTAGFLAAIPDNLTGMAGVQWNARVLPVRVAGKCGASLTDIIDGMYWAAGLSLESLENVPPNPTPARVISISFGGNAPCNRAYQQAIDDLYVHGVLVVAAAGNEHGPVARPANCRGAVGVAALNRDGFKARYSSFGPGLAIATVGGDPFSPSATEAWNNLADTGLVSLSNSGAAAPDEPGYALVSGTSFSVPITAGVMGLMLSAYPEMTAEELRRGLEQSARPHVTSDHLGACSALNPGRCLCSTDTCGAGILDADEAVRYAHTLRDQQPYVAPPRSAAVVDSPELEAAVASGNDLPPNVAQPPRRSSGGGALDGVWLLSLALAIGLLRNPNRRTD